MTRSPYSRRSVAGVASDNTPIAADKARVGAPIVRGSRGDSDGTDQRLIDPAFAAALDARSLEELRAMKSECNDVENALSYRRRLAQARIEILEAEDER